MPSGKSTVNEIRERFDKDVERFSNLETGQTATIDAPLALELIAASAAVMMPGAASLLDVGCGAGNYSIKLLQKIPAMRVTLIDLSRPMLDRAVQRVTAAGASSVAALQSDIRAAALQNDGFDIIVAAAVLHYLRSDEEWEAVFAKFHRACEGGSLWISDLVEQSLPAVHKLTWERYGDYLVSLKGEEYRKTVFDYIEKEDTPRPLIRI